MLHHLKFTSILARSRIALHRIEISVGKPDAGRSKNAPNPTVQGEIDHLGLALGKSTRHSYPQVAPKLPDRPIGVDSTAGTASVEIAAVRRPPIAVPKFVRNRGIVLDLPAPTGP